MPYAIVVDDLHSSWPDGGVLFDGLSFTVGPGRTALVGVNGSGKSTLLRLIAGELGEMSGGEAVLLGLAAQFLRRPEVLLLDEPTNNLDLASTRQLAQALAAYRGALLMASHDLPFLRDAGITRWLRLDGQLTSIDPP